MPSTNPPGSGPGKTSIPITLQLLRTIRPLQLAGTAPLNMMAVAPTPKAFSASSTLGRQLVNYLPDAIHMVALSELSGAFRPRASGRFAIASPATVPNFSVDGLAGAAYQPSASFLARIVDDEVRFVRNNLDPSYLEESRDQIDWPSLWLSTALNLHEAHQQGLGLATAYAVDVAHLQASEINMHLKELLGVPRPNDAGWTAPVQTPLLEMPHNRSFPGGHACTMFTAITVLDSLLGPQASACRTQLKKVASFLADNRRRAGLHTSLDNEVGAELGVWLGGQLVQGAADSEKYPHWAALCELARSEWV
jgi:hypothetical protein